MKGGNCLKYCNDLVDKANQVAWSQEEVAKGCEGNEH